MKKYLVGSAVRDKLTVTKQIYLHCFKLKFYPKL